MKIELDTIESRIDKRLESLAEPPRPHFGISGIGDPCERKMWLRHGWAVIESFSGRMLRLFNRGHNEEPVMAAYLRGIGIDLRKTGFDQVKVDFGSHVKGSIDGIIFSGVPEAPKKLHTWENKTASDKSFNEIKSKGIEKAKPDHYAQILGYLLGTFDEEFKRSYGFGDIDRCLYTVVNKNTDEIYTERVRLDKTKAEALVVRARRIATADRMPVPLSTDPSWHQCRFCPAHDFCHVSKTTKEVNCRTCAHATAEPSGEWTCALHPGSAIPVEFQREGCRSHVVNPDLVPWKMKEGVGNSAVYVIDGKEVINGEDGKDSRELIGPGALFGKVFGGEVEVVDFDGIRSK